MSGGYEIGKNRGSFRNKFDGSPDSYQFRNRYYFDTQELDALEKWNDKPNSFYNLDLTAAQGPGGAAGAAQGPLVINEGGRAFSFIGFTKATQYDPAANTGIETVVTTVYINVRINKDDPAYAISVKHGMGYVGDFNKLFIRWPAQASNAGRLYLHKFDEVPFQSGASPT